MFTPNPSTTFNTMMAQNQLMDITDYLNEYGPEITNTLGEDLLAATSKDGRIYGVGNYGPLTFKAMLLVRRDLADAAGVTQDWKMRLHGPRFTMRYRQSANSPDRGLSMRMSTAACSWPILRCVPEKISRTGYVYDNLGDSANMFMANKETGKVECMYFNEDVKEVLRRTYDWYQDGLIYKDAAMSQDFAQHF